MKATYDVVVIGAGSGGLTAAVGCRNIGKSVLLVEQEKIGGECTNSGCIPSKALLHHAKSYYRTKIISGISPESEAFRAEAFNYVRNKINETLALETPAHFSKMGIDVVWGEAVFTGPNTLSVNQTNYQFKKAIIATGSSPKSVVIAGLDPGDILTNQNLFDLKDVPTNTLVIGAGPVGMEMGQALAMLGSQVTILDNGPTFAHLEDPVIQPILKKSFVDLGISILQNAAIQNIENKTAYITQGTEPVVTKVSFDKVLMAVGRVPSIPKGLDQAVVRISETGIAVSHNYQTTNRHIYALGDVADRMKFTHVADDVARQVVTRIATFGVTSVKGKAIPKVTYTEPEIAQVGLSQFEAEKQFGEKGIHRIEVPFSTNDRARTDSATEGVLVVLVKRLSGKILGAHIAGARAGELIAVFTLAIDNNLSLWKLRRSIYAYPTYALLIKKAGDYFFAQQVSSLKSDMWNSIKKVLPKVLVASLWLAGLVALYRYQINHNMSVTDTALMVFDFISMTAWGPLVYILAYAIRPVTFIPGTAITILSGVFFGLWGGIIYTIIGANLSATLAYVIGRFFSGKGNQSSRSTFNRFTEACRNNPFTTILTMRLIFLPYDGVNFGAGLLRIPYLPYILATIIGTLLGIATFVSIGASLSIDEFRTTGISVQAIDSTFLILSVGIFVVSLAVSKLITHFSISKK